MYTSSQTAIKLYIIRLYQAHLITDSNQTLYYKVASSKPPQTGIKLYIIRLYQVHLITNRNPTLYYKVVSSTPHHKQELNFIL
jgi:hypothetical protein